MYSILCVLDYFGIIGWYGCQIGGKCIFQCFTRYFVLGTDCLSAAIFAEVAVSALVLTVRNCLCMRIFYFTEMFEVICLYNLESLRLLITVVR